MSSTPDPVPREVEIRVTSQVQAYAFVDDWCKTHGQINASFVKLDDKVWVFSINDTDPDIQFEVTVDIFGTVSRRTASK